MQLDNWLKSKSIDFPEFNIQEQPLLTDYCICCHFFYLLSFAQVTQTRCFEVVSHLSTK